MTELLQPGRGDDWWVDGSVRVVRRGEQVWRFDGQWRAVEGDWIHGPDGLTVVDERPVHDGLPMGAKRARTAPVGDVVIWRSEGFVYRKDGDRIRPGGRLRGDNVVVGPGGALLLGEALLTHGAAAGGSTQRLPTRLQPDSLRWSGDGTRVAGLDLRDRTVIVDLTRCALVEDRRPGCVPVNAEGGVLIDATGRLEGVQGEPIQVGGGAPFRLGRHLAGPARVIWDLVDERPLFDDPVVGPGVSVGHPGGDGIPRLLNVHWETGEGRWVTPDGQVHDPFQLPLAEDDVLVGGERLDGVIRVYTALGHGFAVEGSKVRDAPWAQVEGRPTEATAGGRLYTWDDDGWLFASD